MGKRINERTGTRKAKRGDNGKRTLPAALQANASQPTAASSIADCSHYLGLADIALGRKPRPDPNGGKKA